MNDVGLEKKDEEVKRPLNAWGIVGLVLAVTCWAHCFYPNSPGHIYEIMSPTLPALALAFCLAGMVTGSRYTDRWIGVIGLLLALPMLHGSLLRP